jgi:hypothetical protein
LPHGSPAPRANVRHSIEPDASGRTGPPAGRLGNRHAYADADARLPMRLQLTQADLEVRIVVLDRH